MRGILVFNARLDAVMAALFLVLVAIVCVSAIKEWRRILSGNCPIENELESTCAQCVGASSSEMAASPDAPVFGEIPRSAGGPRCC